MKLLVVFAVIACSYADKLDRTYLPPESAATAGGSPGSIAAPGTEAELGLPKGTSTFGQPSRPSFGHSTGASVGETDSASGLGPNLAESQSGRPGAGQPGTPYQQPQFGSPRPGQPGAGPSGSPYNPTGPQFGSYQPGQPGAGPAGSQYEPSGPQFGSPRPGQSGASSPLKPTGSQFGLAQPGQLGTDSAGSQYEPSGSQFGSSRPGLPGSGQTGSPYQQTSPQAGLQQLGQSGIGPAGSEYSPTSQNDVGKPGFGPASAGLNVSPAFGTQLEGLRPNSGQFQSERPLAASDRNAEILRYENNIDGDTFSYSFETSNGIAADEAGTARNGVQAKGGFSYTGDDGQVYSVRYTADENGYVPQGDHLPTPPPIPEEILKSLEENARAAAAGIQEGAYNPNEDSGLDNGASYPGVPRPGQASSGYQPGQDSDSQYGFPGTSLGSARPQSNQGFDSKYGGPGSASRPQNAIAGIIGSPGSPGIGSSTFLSGSQYGIPGVSPSTARPVSQGGQSPDYNDFGAPSSDITDLSGSSLSPQGNKSPAYGTINNGGQKGYKPNFTSQVGQPSGSKPRFPTPTNQSPLSQFGTPATTIFGSSNPGQSFPSQKGPYSGSPNTTPGVSSANTGFPSQYNQNSGYQYNTPGATSSNEKPDSQRFPSQIGSSPVTQYGNSAGSPSSPSAFSRPQGITSGSPARPGTYDSQSPTNDYNAPSASLFGISGPGSQRFPSQAGQSSPSGKPSGFEASRPYGNQSPTSAFASAKPTDAQSFSIPSSQGPTPQYPSLSPAGLAKQPGQYQPDFNQRPQFGSTALSGSPGSNLIAPSRKGTQEQDESGYKYSRPQTQFGGQQNSRFPDLSGSRFETVGPVGSSKSQGTTFGSNLSQVPSGTSGDIYNQPGSAGSANQGFPSDSSVPTIDNNNQQSPFARPGGYSGLSSRPNSFNSRPDSSVGYFGSKPQSSKTPGFMPSTDSAPYQYNRPGSQNKPEMANTKPGFGPQEAGTDFGLPGQKSPGQASYQPGFGSSVQNKPGQIGFKPSHSVSRPGQGDSQPTFGPSGQERPGQSGSKPGFGSVRPERPEQGDSEPGFGPSGQERPGQSGYKPGFGSVQQDKPGQSGSHPGYGSSGKPKPQFGFDPSEQDKPGQSGKQPEVNSLGQKRPVQNGYGPSKEDRPVQFGTQPNFGTIGQSGPSQSGNFNNLGQIRPDQAGSSGQNKPSQTDSQSEFGTAEQLMPSQGRPAEDFSGPRQPPSFSKEEGYKY